MIPKIHQICGCELCIITKEIQIDLNRFRTRLVTFLQQKFLIRHTCNILFSTTSSAHYQDKLFPDNGYLHATIKDVAHCNACLTIK